MNKGQLQQQLCEQLCANVVLVERPNNKLMVSAPLSHPDGDTYSIYLEQIKEGYIRISDGADTLMRLSYTTPDIEKYFKGARGKLVEQILREHQAQEDDGNFYIDVATDSIAEAIFRLGQAIGKIYDLTYLDRDRAGKSTFYEDLGKLLTKITGKLSIALEEDYQVQQLKKPEDYLVDYSLISHNNPVLYVFGIPNIDKVKLVTIILQHFTINDLSTRSLLIFDDIESLSSKHIGRLMDANIGGSLVSSIQSEQSIEKNVELYMAA